MAASRRSRAMKNPSVRSRSGRVCRKRGSRPSGELGVGGAEIVGPDRGVVARAAPRAAPRSRARRSCRSRRRACPRGCRAPAARAQDGLLYPSQALDQLGRLPPPCVGPGGERAEIGAGRIHEDPIVAATEVGACSVRFDHPDADDAQPLAELAQLAGPAGVELDGDDLALVSHSGRDRGRLDARRRAEIEHALAGLRIEHRHHRLRAARLRDQGAVLESFARHRSEPAAHDQPLGRRQRRRGASARSTSSPAARSSPRIELGSALIVFTRSAVSAGSFIAAITARASAGPSSCHHIRASHSG